METYRKKFEEGITQLQRVIDEGIWDNHKESLFLVWLYSSE